MPRPAGAVRWERLRHCMQTPRDLVESLLLLGVLIAAAVVCQEKIPNWASAASRLLSPWEFVPAVGKVGTIEIAPKDAEILIGGSQEITADIKNPDALAYDACIYVKPEGEEESSQPLVGDEKHRRYKYTLSSMLKGREISRGDRRFANADLHHQSSRKTHRFRSDRHISLSRLS